MDEIGYIITNISKEEWEILKDNGINICNSRLYWCAHKDVIIFGEGEYNKAMELLKRK